MEGIWIAAFIMLQAFIWTAAIEGLLMELLYPFWKLEKSRWRVLYASFLCNFLTNPALNGLNLIFSFQKLDIYALEVVVIFVEAFVYRRLLECSRKKAFLISFLLNLVSYLLGELLL